jgi:trigger factor
VGESTPTALPVATESAYLSLEDLDIFECVSVTYKGLSAQTVDTALPDEEYEYALFLLLSEYATTERITDRAVENGDTINIDYITVKGDTLVTDFWEDGAEIIVGGGTTFAEFEEELGGRLCGKDFDVDVVLPESISEEYGGQEVTVMVTINYIQSDPVLPELTDEFVSSLDDWDCATVEEFEETYRSYLEEKKAEYYGSAYKDALWEQVMAGAVFLDKSEEFINSLVRQRSDEYEANAESSGITLDEMASYYGYDGGDAFMEAVAQSAAEEARTLLVVTYIAETEGIAYTDEEYYDAADDLAEYLGFDSTADLINGYGLSYVEETVHNSLLYGLVQDFVVENAVLEQTS